MKPWTNTNKIEIFLVPESRGSIIGRVGKYLCGVFCVVSSYLQSQYLSISMANPHMIDEILARIQNVEIVKDDEEEFFFLMPNDVAVSYEENKCSCAGKHVVDCDVNVQGLRRFPYSVAKARF